MNRMATIASEPRRKSPLSAQRLGFRNLRRIRLVSGLIVFVYVACHIVNLALGNISVDAMQSGVHVATAVWRSWPGTIALYGALIVHTALGFWALYERRMFRYRSTELPQLILGLLIPFMLINHIVVTRLAYVLYGTDKGYIQELYQFWVASPFQGFNQAAVLIIAWTHACIGLHLWLRLRGWYRSVSPALLGIAVLTPALGLLGFFQGGRAILAAAESTTWQDLNVSAVEMGTLAERTALADLRNAILAAFAILLIAVFVLRRVRDWRERRGGVVTLTYPDRRSIRAPKGLSLLEASTRYEMPHAGVCGGRGRCGTCRVAVLAGLENLPPPGEVERAVLERIGSAAGSRIRIGCQVRPVGDVTLAPVLPHNADPTYAYGKRRIRTGRRRETVCMFIEFADIADAESNTDGENQMFRVNRFIEAAIEAVTRAGGEFNRLSGAGILALFDARPDPARAARRAIDAAAMVGVNVDHLTRLLGEREKMPFVIGMDIGVATLGDVSAKDDVAFTAVGGVVRDSADLCDVARAMSCEVAFTERLHNTAGLPKDSIPAHTVTMPGSSRQVEARCATSVSTLFGALDAIADAAVQGHSRANGKTSDSPTAN